MESEWSFNVWKFGLTQMGFTKAAQFLDPAWLYVAGRPVSDSWFYSLWVVPSDNSLTPYLPFGNGIIGLARFPSPFLVHPDADW